MSKDTKHEPLIFDAHLDISMNALEWNRDQRWTVDQIRQSEQGMSDNPDRARNTVSFPALKEGNVGLVVATQIGRVVKPGGPIPGWYSQEQAWAHTQGQLQWYRCMEEAGEMKQITDASSLAESLSIWESPSPNSPICYLLSLEGADSLVSMKHLEQAYEQGLRAIGPAHYGPGIYANGTDASGRLNPKGVELLKTMEELHMILDMTHLNDDAFWHTLELYKGPICNVTLDIMVDNIDHVCQLAGNSLHAGIGSDLDGAFGTEQCPHDLDTIADLQKLPDLLKTRGYGEEDVHNILHGNFVRFLQNNLE
jgi:membrane dipeptidase